MEGTNSLFLQLSVYMLGNITLHTLTSPNATGCQLMVTAATVHIHQSAPGPLYGYLCGLV